MNKARRKTLDEIRDQIQDLRDQLEEVMNEEEEYRDNMPENLQNSERYEIAENACSNLDDALSSIESAAE